MSLPVLIYGSMKCTNHPYDRRNSRNHVEEGSHTRTPNVVSDGRYNLNDSMKTSSRRLATPVNPSMMQTPSGAVKKTHQRSSSVVPVSVPAIGLNNVTASMRDTKHRSNALELPGESPAMAKSTFSVGKSTTNSKLDVKALPTLTSPAISKRRNEDSPRTPGKQATPTVDIEGVQTRKMAKLSSVRTQRPPSEPTSITSARPVKRLEEAKSGPKSEKPVVDHQLGDRTSSATKSPRTGTMGPPLVVITKGTSGSGNHGAGTAPTTSRTTVMLTPSRPTSRIPRPDPSRRSMAGSLSTPITVKGTTITDSLQRQALGKSLSIKPTRKVSLSRDRELGVSTPLLGSASHMVVEEHLSDPMLDDLDVREATVTLSVLLPVEEMAACSLDADSGRSPVSSEQKGNARKTSLANDGGPQDSAQLEEKPIQDFFESEADEIDAFGGKSVPVNNMASSNNRLESSLLIEVQKYQLELENLKQEKRELAARLEMSMQQTARAEIERKKAGIAKLFMDLATACQVELDRLQQERKNRACQAVVLGDTIHWALMGHSSKGAEVSGV